MRRRITCWVIQSGQSYLSNSDDDSGFPYRTWATKKAAQQFLELREIGLMPWVKNAKIIRVSIQIESCED